MCFDENRLSSFVAHSSLDRPLLLQCELQLYAYAPIAAGPTPMLCQTTIKLLHNHDLTSIFHPSWTKFAGASIDLAARFAAQSANRACQTRVCDSSNSMDEPSTSSVEATTSKDQQQEEFVPATSFTGARDGYYFSTGDLLSVWHER